MGLTDAQLAAKQAAQAQVSVKANELSAAKQALANADPQGALAIQLQEEQQTLRDKYITPIATAAAKEYNECLEAGQTLHNLNTLVAPSAEYTQTLKTQADHLTKEQSQLSQKIRTQRRAFLDSFPQSNIGGAYHVPHSSDDFAMFLLFIGYISAGVAFYLTSPLTQTTSKWMALFVGVMGWILLNQLVLRLG
jgi:hypothetical protein